ncbi:uncharacterized protein AAG666_009950 [Megaptera novaeangliae]
MDQKQNINPETQATDLMDSKSRCSGDTQELGSCEVPRASFPTDSVVMRTRVEIGQRCLEPTHALPEKHSLSPCGAASHLLVSSLFMAAGMENMLKWSGHQLHITWPLHL